MANRYFAGNSLAAFLRTSTAIVESTTAGRFNSTYVASSISFPNLSAAYVQSTTFAATGTVWLRFDTYGPANLSGVNGTGPALYNGTTGVFRIVTTNHLSSTTWQCQYWNGSAWTNTGSTFTTTAASLVTMVAKVILNSSFELYVGGTLVASGSGWTGGGTAVDSVRLYPTTNQSTVNYSEVMVADYDLRDSHFLVPALNGNSATNTGGTGAYTDINETVLDESTAVKVTTSGNKQGQTKASITVPAGYIIGAVVLSARGRVSGSITDGKLGVRTSGGTNSSGSGLGYNGGYEPRQRIVANDPDTATNFTQSGFNSAEIYEEAV